MRAHTSKWQHLKSVNFDNISFSYDSVFTLDPLYKSLAIYNANLPLVLLPPNAIED